MRVSIMGASGYIGGELLRLLLGHPRVELAQVTSDRYAGQPVPIVHPNLRGQTNLAFTRHEALTPCDVLFLALPHGAALARLPYWANLAERIIDLSADFRLTDPHVYELYYGQTHLQPAWLDRFVPGIPELYRARLAEATRIATPGCIAVAAILALYPLAKAGVIDGESIIDARTGSSGGGVHTGRANMMRVYQPLGHRHEAEVAQACGIPVRVSATAVEAVRGVQVVCHIRLTPALDMKKLWGLYRHAYRSEPFIRLVAQQTGSYRLPEPKILIGSNYCDVGFVIDEQGRNAVVVAALDNLVKGGAGNAVQCLNLALGWNEREGLGFPGLHPI
jgi:LysW-gamma-L-alpha-aminoadipyl-6-phosphate/LysW-L-glutamyl-5-phosphate reductase